jgi:thioredoxin-like negative regulator of GroEL
LPSFDERTEQILAEADDRLAAGQAVDAALAFERVLLSDPGHDEARVGLARAQSALAEQRRRLDACLEEARRLAEEGDWEAARPLLDRIEAEGGDRDAARALRDRIASPRGELRPGAPADDSPAPAARRPARRRQLRPRLRRAVAMGLSLLFVAVAGGTLARWDSLLTALTARPTPRALSAEPRPAYPPPTAGEQALALAARRLEAGDPDGALQALASVSPEDPAFPFASQMRSRADRARREGAR